MADNKSKKHTINRISWIGIFLIVSTVLVWTQIQGDQDSGMGWFLALSLWSAVCGIGFSVCDWLLRGRIQPSASDSSKSRTPSAKKRPSGDQPPAT